MPKTVAEPEVGGEVESVLAVLTKETLRRRRQNRNLRAAWGILVGVEVVATGILWFRKHEFDTSLLPSLLLLGGSMTMGMTSTLKAATRAAAVLNDKRALGPLLEIVASPSGDPDLTTLARDTIRSLVPTVTAPADSDTDDDTPLLDPAQRNTLHHLLQTSTDADLVLDLLLVVERIGSVAAIPPLEAIVHTGRVAVSGTDVREKVIDRARRTLATVRFRVARDVITRTAGTPAAATVEIEANTPPDRAIVAPAVQTAVVAADTTPAVVARLHASNRSGTA